MHIVDFMEHVLKDAPYTVDFILETYDSHRHTAETVGTSYLEALRVKFSDCFDRKWRGSCEYRDTLTRFHFNDVRMNFKKRNEESLKAYYDGIFQENGVIPDLSAAYDALAPFEKTAEQWKDIMITGFKVDKQLSFCTKAVSDIIWQWLDEKLAQATNSFSLKMGLAYFPSSCTVWNRWWPFKNLAAALLKRTFGIFYFLSISEKDCKKKIKCCYVSRKVKRK